MGADALKLDPPLSRQRQTQAARKAFAERFKTPEEKSEYFRELARGRLVLSASEAEALVNAYQLLSRIAERAQDAAA